jgi:hypothetical protein
MRVRRGLLYQSARPTGQDAFAGQHVPARVRQERLPMDGLFYLLSILGVGCIMWWVLQNDRVRPDRPTTGLFAMRPGSELLKRRSLRGGQAAAPPPPAARKSPF